MLYLVWHNFFNYKYNTLHCVLGLGNAFLISCPNPCRAPPLDMRLYPRTLAPSGRCSLLAALTWNCVLYIHVHHCTTLVLLCYQATVSLHIVCSREKGDLHIYYYTLHLLHQKALSWLFDKALLDFVLFYSHKMDKRNSNRRWTFCG
jgi:hypothetical protein